MYKIERMIYIDEAAEELGLPLDAMQVLVEKGHLRVMIDYTNGKVFTYNAWLTKTKAMLKPKRQTAPLNFKAPIYQLSAVMG